MQTMTEMMPIGIQGALRIIVPLTTCDHASLIRGST
jgi:hypothetical protein